MKKPFMQMCSKSKKFQFNFKYCSEIILKLHFCVAFFLMFYFDTCYHNKKLRNLILKFKTFLGKQVVAAIVNCS